MLSDNTEIRLVNKNKDTFKIPIHLEINILLNNVRIKEEIIWEIRKYLILIDNENTIYQNLWM